MEALQGNNGGAIVTERLERVNINLCSSKSLKPYSSNKTTYHLDRVTFNQDGSLRVSPLAHNGAGGPSQLINEEGIQEFALAYFEGMSFNTRGFINPYLKRLAEREARREYNQIRSEGGRARGRQLRLKYLKKYYKELECGTSGSAKLRLTSKLYPYKADGLSTDFGLSRSNLNQRLAVAEFIHKPWTENQPASWRQYSFSSVTVDLEVKWNFCNGKQKIIVSSSPSLPSGPQRFDRGYKVTPLEPDGDGGYNPPKI